MGIPEPLLCTEILFFSRSIVTLVRLINLHAKGNKGGDIAACRDSQQTLWSAALTRILSKILKKPGMSFKLLVTTEHVSLVMPD